MKRRQSRGAVELPEPIQPFRDLSGGALCLDFANTAENPGDEYPVDYLFPGYGNLVTWLLHAEILDTATATSLMRAARRDPREAVQVRRRAIALRDAIRAAALRNAGKDDLQVLQDEWHQASAHRLLTPDPERGMLHWHWPTSKRLDAPLWPIIASAIDLLTTDHGDRLRSCAATGCTSLFLDTTRNGNRRFCQAQGCGNRTRVRRFRESRNSAP